MIAPRSNLSRTTAFALALAALIGCRAATLDSAADTGTYLVRDSVARAQTEGAPSVLVVVAHPDDEFACGALLFKAATHLGSRCEVLTITDGQGGFKYATFGALLHGVDLTDEAVGRRELPRLRFEEQVASARLLGIHALHYLGEADHRYTTDLAEVLGERATAWRLERVRAALRAHLERGAFDFVVVLAPTPATHAHHQAASLLAAEAAASLPAAARPAVLCVEVLAEGERATSPELLAGEPLARIREGPFELDRTQRFGHREALDYRLIVDAAIARHATQGSMLKLMGRGAREAYWLIGDPPPDARRRAARFFERLAEPQFEPRVYGESAGTNAAPSGAVP